MAERKRPATASAAPGGEKRTNWVNVVTVVSAVILVGAEVFGVAIAAGWAIAGLFELGTEVGYVLMALFSLFGAYLLWAFYKRAVEIEPISDRA